MYAWVFLLHRPGLLAFELDVVATGGLLWTFHLATKRGPLLLLFDVELFEVDALAAETSAEPEVEAEGALAAASSSSCLREVLRFRLRTSLMRLEKKQKHEAYNRTRKC